MKSDKKCKENNENLNENCKICYVIHNKKIVNENTHEDLENHINAINKLINIEIVDSIQERFVDFKINFKHDLKIYDIYSDRNFKNIIRNKLIEKSSKDKIIDLKL